MLGARVVHCENERHDVVALHLAVRTFAKSLVMLALSQSHFIPSRGMEPVTISPARSRRMTARCNKNNK